MSSRDLAEQADGLILSQYAGSPNLHATVKATVGILQELDDDATRLANFADLSSATGTWLDRIGGIRNIPRNSGEDDAVYLSRFKVQTARKSAGTPDGIIGDAVLLSGDAAPVFFDESPATFIVYTPNGNQIARNKIRKLAPTGVLGLPGAAIVTATGKKVTGCNGKKILGVAIDANIGNDGAYTLLTENEDNITTETGEILTTEKGV